MELVRMNNNAKDQGRGEDIITSLPSSGTHKTEVKLLENNQFIKANSTAVSLSHLREDCIIPVFANDNEQTISHSEFIEQTRSAVEDIFQGEEISEPAIRASHMIKGRTPDAIGVAVKDLREEQKTIYYERMAFLFSLPGITQTIDGNQLTLSVGGVRAYNHENLYSKKSAEKFKFFIGFENMVCCNMCIGTDGYKKDYRTTSLTDLNEAIVNLISSYEMKKHYQSMRRLVEQSLSEKQFAQLIGKARLYQYLPKKEKEQLPELLYGESHFSSIAKDYYSDKSFCKEQSGDINLWKVYNLITGANKSSYIDTFLERGVNAFEFTQGLSKAISGDSDYRWFLS
ncbi:DUF3871 family protein [Gramella jeungdoensis]|uniref:DUF3871 family protein n=1 Tax=Gramella jeungdoensis TaxID=708091 RepID=A0ABT0Z1U3_9FLAO|nr:DUF3871 family protein [Gramella jeungdoensis]MCM8569693.1 DUF3871 family protein [Gramella jeungdoensis]